MEPNVSEIVGVTLSDLIKSSFSGLKVSAGESFERLAFDLRAGYEDYFGSLRDKNSVIKTILRKDRPINFHDCYVELRIKCENEELSDNGFLHAINSGARFVVTGTGGIGKSMLMRFLLLKMISGDTFSRIPIFIELRTLHDSDHSVSIIEAIQKAASFRRSSMSAEVVQHGLKKGAYTLLLDGFDELDPDVRDRYEREILEISDLYPGCAIVTSGRPDDRFATWPHFSVYQVQKLDIDELTALVQRMPIESLLKERFLSAVKDRLWETHQEFLEIPILATIMVMTFDQLAHIPGKMNVFYDEAFHNPLPSSRRLKKSVHEEDAY